MKWCPRCETERPVSEFPRHRSKPDGLYSCCKPCKRAAAAEWKATADPTGERHRAYVRKHRDKNIERHRRRERENKKRQKLQDPEGVRARRKAWEAQNRDVLRAAWKLNTHTRRAQKRANGAVPFTADQLDQRIAYYGYRCWICGADHEAIDHVKPLSKGGPHMLANLRPICTSCNSSKGAEWPLVTTNPKGATDGR